MVQVVLGFDTEDYISPFSDESIVRLARIMNDRGIPGCFNFVAELAGRLHERGRDDIIELLKNHEINYHTCKHSWHPTVIEYSDTEDWYRGYARFASEESRGIGIVKNVFHRDRLWAAVPPGNSIAAQALYAYRDLGVNIFYGSLFENTGGEGIWFCNMLNLEYNGYMDGILLAEGLEGIKARLEEWKGWKRLILCCHPNIILYKEFADEINFKGVNRVKWGEWTIPEKRSEIEIEHFYSNFAAMLQMLKEDGNFKFVTMEDIWKEQRGRTAREISYERLADFLGRIKGNLFFVKHGNRSYSLADLFGAAVHYLCNRPCIYRTEEWKGPIFEPVGVVDEIELEAEKIREAAFRLSDCKIIPEKINVGGADIGPGDFLRAAGGVLEGREMVLVRPGPQLPDTSGFYNMDGFTLRNTWLHPEDLKDEWVTKRLKWQSWTLRSE